VKRQINSMSMRWKYRRKNFSTTAKQIAKSGQDVVCVNSLSLCFNGHFFPGEPRLASFIEAKDNGGVATTGVIRCAKFQSNHHHQQTNTQCFMDRMPFLSPNEQHQSTEGKVYVNCVKVTQTHLNGLISNLPIHPLC